MAKFAQTRVGRFLERNKLTREQIGTIPWLQPFAGRIRHRELWRFTRRSVPRGVALGLLVGLFLLIPGIQIIGVALLAYPVRANIPIGAAMTFLSMPATTPFILAASLWVGDSLLHLGADVSTFQAMIEHGAGFAEWMAWIVGGAAPAILVGLAIISVVAAAIGYVIAALTWRWWIGRKWRRRHHHHHG